jgi:16S rRNA (guanine527-N7)-methyltransferase
MQAKLAGIAELNDAQVQALESHFNLLVRWNRVLNLTSVDTLEEAVERHYCEAVFLALHLPSGSLKIADIGSGAGFPGVPVAVVRSDCEIALIESHRRKAVFLREASRAIPNVRVLRGRAEEVNEEFDWAISRAVSYLDLAPALKKLAEAAYLLTGGEGPPAGLGFQWQQPVRLPWGGERFLRSGRRIDGPSQ